MPICKNSWGGGNLQCDTSCGDMLMSLQIRKAGVRLGMCVWGWAHQGSLVLHFPRCPLMRDHYAVSVRMFPLNQNQFAI